ncbi:ribonuclease HII [Candidatus Bathycorpusculum sp.]|uniref:ribonuclease HII n=1 Tax=Candidatus Bathycorpusculum sp. TaxID=2994959 RepID=UPI00282AF055|nr:ribonuclease HII [Candidatus Termitimicrobium sp.]MCL2685613.1 ribonuclease HII [Candidatus Termitimicrobium sp.]
MLVAGVDEAGRGCVIGPLVVAGVVVLEENLPGLLELGVADSKMLSAKRRETLYPEILRLVKSHHVIKVPPYLIDRAVNSTRVLYKLNHLEAHTMAKVIQELGPDKAFVDAADVVAQRFGNYIREFLVMAQQPIIVSEHKADRNYAVVAAASIIAKVERDLEIQRLQEKYGDFGSGYLGDGRTLVFLRRLLAEGHGVYPSCVRKSWEPARRVRAEYGSSQKLLG